MALHRNQIPSTSLLTSHLLDSTAPNQTAGAYHRTVGTRSLASANTLDRSESKISTDLGRPRATHGRQCGAASANQIEQAEPCLWSWLILAEKGPFKRACSMHRRKGRLHGKTSPGCKAPDVHSTPPRSTAGQHCCIGSPLAPAKRVASLNPPGSRATASAAADQAGGPSVPAAHCCRCCAGSLIGR